MPFPSALLLAAALQGVTGDSILIGMEGETKSFSADEENLGMRLVIREVNDQGGIHGRQLVERSYRRGNDPVEDPLRNAKRLVEEDGVFLLFNFGGPASVPLGAYAMEARVPFLFPHTALLTVDSARYVFTSFPRFEGETRVVLRHLAEELAVERIAVIHDPNAYGSYFRDRVRDLAPELSYRFVGSREVASRDPATADEEVAAVKALDPDAVILALYPAQAGKVMESRAKLGWTSARMVATGPLTDEQYLDVPGGASEGTLGFCLYPDPESAKGPGLDEYRALMKKHFPEKRLNRYSLYGYVFGKLVIEGLERASRELTREGFVDAMESIRGWDSGGILPAVTFGKTDHHAQTAGFLCELTNGKFEPLTGWIEP
ncbi:MAG TPA: ABC transporter substrate-binding protein [Vicinamibacteria bacterium]|nr:ABC transporter substrate-binding protein [Vicinamibacteria bacterium]